MAGWKQCFCGHKGDDHSQILLGGPCLDCPCPGMMPDEPPNPYPIVRR